MEQAVILLWGFTGFALVGGILGIIYYFYDEKKHKAAH